MDGWLAYHAVFIAAVTGALPMRNGCRTARPRPSDSVLDVPGHQRGIRRLAPRGVQGAPSALAWLQRAPLRPFAATSWSRMLRPPMGELYFAGHARNAPDEMRALGSRLWLGSANARPISVSSWTADCPGGVHRSNAQERRDASSSTAASVPSITLARDVGESQVVVAGMVTQPLRTPVPCRRPARSATMPLACSMTTRLLRAWLSCSLTTLGLVYGPLLQDGDGRHVGQRLTDQ